MSQHPLEAKTLLTIIYSTERPVDREARLYRRLLGSRLKYEQQFRLEVFDEPLTTQSVKEIVSRTESKYILFVDSKHEVAPNYVKTFIEYLQTRTVYLAEPFLYFGTIPKDPTKTVIDDKYLYGRDTDIYGVAFNTNRLNDTLQALHDIDKSAIYVAYRLYWSLVKIKPISTGYSTANNTRAVIGSILDPKATRLFPILDTQSHDLKIHMLRFLTVFLRGLRSNKETHIPREHLTAITQKYRLDRLTKLLGPMQQFELSWIEWLGNPQNSDVLFKQLSNKDAYLSFEMSDVPETSNAIYSIRLESEYLNIARKYVNCELRKNFGDPSVYDFYSRKVTEESTIIFYDRPLQADDNAEYLYEYFRTKLPNFQNCYFALSPKSTDWNRLEQRGFKLVPFFSKKFYELFLESDVVISSQIYNLSYKGKNLKNSRSIYLQHGIQLNDMSDWINSKHFDVFVATGKPEEEYIKTCAPVETLNSGLPRLETLERKPKTQRQILFMPTWRFNLNTVSDQQFIQSDYFASINRIMTDEKMLRYLKERDVFLQVKLHPNIAARTKLFNFSERVLLCEESYREAISASDFAFTDYSSVVLDAAFIEIPIAYYQWDAETFFEEQPYESRVDYNQDGLGPVFHQSHQIIEYITDEAFKDSNEKYFANHRKFFDGVERDKINSKIVERMLNL